jgi:microcystin-dependent protein
VAKDGSTTPSSLPVGSIIYYGGFTAPTGYLLGYGQAISRLTYSGLYAALSLQTTATTSSGNHVITGIPDTTGMVAGMPIDGTGIPAGQSSTVTITIATPGVVSWTGHGLQNGQPIVLSTDGALPTGLVAGTTYYVVARAADTFQLAATTGGMAINTTGSQSGTHTATTSGTIIVTVDSSSQLTLSANATASGSGVDIVVLPHGPGDHSTTFNVPDCRGRVMAGRDDMGGTAANRLASGVTGSRVGASGGAEQHVLTEAEMPIHSHTPAYNNVTGLIGSGGFAFAAGAQSTGASVDLTIATAGGGQPHPIVQPTLVTNCLVKAQ